MATKNPAEKFAYLDQLSTEELEELIRADIESPNNENSEAIFHILEVLNKRAEEDAEGPIFEKERVWHDIQTVYNVPEGAGRSLYPTDDEDEDEDEENVDDQPLATDAGAETPKHRRFKWGLSTVAAVIVVLSVTMIGAQASGIDIFGFFARWAEEVFIYTPESEYCPAIREAFVANHFPEELVPTWYPSGFVASEPMVEETEFLTTISVYFGNDAEDRYFSVTVRRYVSTEALTTLEHQRDFDSQEQHTSGNKTFFLVSNEGHTTATWSDQDTLVINIVGNLSVRDVKKIIDSIGG